MDRIPLLARQQPDFRQHGGVGLGPGDVLGGEAGVEGDAFGEGLHPRVRPPREPPAPRLLRVLRALSGGGVGHQIERGAGEIPPAGGGTAVRSRGACRSGGSLRAFGPNRQPPRAGRPCRGGGRGGVAWADPAGPPPVFAARFSAARSPNAPPRFVRPRRSAGGPRVRRRAGPDPRQTGHGQGDPRGERSRRRDVRSPRRPAAGRVVRPRRAGRRPRRARRPGRRLVRRPAAGRVAVVAGPVARPRVPRRRRPSPLPRPSRGTTTAGRTTRSRTAGPNTSRTRRTGTSRR